jgi:parvulin-like peptidyl-prolyl isomerase
MRLRSIPALLVVCVLALAASACGGDSGPKTAADVPADAIGLVSSTAIPIAEFNALMERAKKSYEAQKQEFPAVGTAEYNDIKTRAVQFLTQQYQFAAEAKNLDIEVSDKEIDDRMAKIVKENFSGDQKQFDKAISDQGLTQDEAREAFRDQILQEKLYEKVTSDVKVTDQEIEDYYKKNEDRFKQPESRDVRHILLKTKAKADEVYAMIDEDGGNFGALAKQYSTDPGTKKNGGQLPVSKGSTVQEFDKVAFDLETGEFSKPIKTQFGWHIIMAESDVRPAKVTPLADIKSSIEQQLVQEQKTAAVNAWLEELKKKYPVVYATAYQPPKAETTTGSATTTAP